MNTILRNRRFRLILAVMAVAAAGALYYGLHVLDGERLVAEAKGLLAPAGTGTLQVESVGGNPLTGYRMEGVAYRREGGTVMTVREVTLRVSLAELLRGTLSLGRVTLEGVTVNLEGFPDFPLPERAALPLPEEILLMDAAFRSGTTQIAVTEARCTPEDRGLRLEGRGRFRDEAFRAEGTFSAGKGGVVLTGGRIAFDRGTLSASGPLLPQLQLRGRILGLPAATLLRLGGGHGSKLRGKVEGSFSISGPPEQLQAAGALILRDLEAETLSIPRCTTSWTYRRDILAFRDLQGSLVDTPVEGALSMDCSTPTPSLQLRLSGADVATEQLYPLFPWLDFAEGEADRVTVALGGPPGALTGRVHVEGYDGTVEGYRFTDLQGDFTVGPHRTGVNAAATWNKATLNARGSLPHDSDGARDLTIRSDTLYLHRAADSFPALAPLQLQGNAAATLHLGGTTGNPESRARFVSTAIRIRNVLLADTVLELGIAPGAIHVEEGRARRDGTPITLQGCIHTGETERLDLAIAADGAAPALLGSLPGFPWLESISGEGKARCRLTGPIDHPAYALQLQAPALDTPLGQLGEVRLKAAFDRSRLALDSCSATLGG
ncbi:MAG: hypothetical protein K9L28_04725, partial [Synergistales bacterium]|nr:hypothetical protein [Synergistales bacterium]